LIKQVSAEVGDAYTPDLVDHHVGGLEVAVQQPLLVYGREPRAELARDLQSLVLREASDALEERRKLLAAHELHRDEVLAFGLAHVVDAADVLVRNLPRGPHLLVEARERRGVVIRGALCVRNASTDWPCAADSTTVRGESGHPARRKFSPRGAPTPSRFTKN
jgi:hypothetical protein